MEISKAEQAFARLRRDILDARLAPGLALTISSLKSRYDLGWTPLREALSRLEAEHLVTFSPNRGYRVADVSAGELLDLQKARKAVETSLLEESIETGDMEWEQRLVAAHHAFRQAAPLRILMPEADLSRWEERHRAFHKALLSGAQATWLQRMAAQIDDHHHRQHRILVLAQAMKGGVGTDDAHHTEILARASNIEHHTRLMEAALARDRAGAVALLHEHIGFTLGAYEELLARGALAVTTGAGRPRRG